MPRVRCGEPARRGRMSESMPGSFFSPPAAPAAISSRREALALALRARGWRVHLATDHRVESYGQDFPADEIHRIRPAR